MCILDKLDIYRKPEEHKKNEIGFGVAVNYKGSIFYYRYAGKYLPEEKVSYMTAEGDYFGRVSGEKDRIIVVPEKEKIIVLEYIPSGFPFIEELKKYKNKTIKESLDIAINIKKERINFEKEQQKIRKTLRL